jgi:hypothetical protein
MDSQQWHEALRRDLRRQNLPAAYIDRLVEELSDHLLDTQTENRSMDAHDAPACLGSTNTIAAAASHEFRRGTFVGRHPWLMFVISPLLIAPLAFALFALLLSYVLYIVGSVLDPAGFPDNALADSALHATAQGFNLLARFVPYIVAAWFYCRLAKRNGRDHWAIAACTILALIAGSIVSEVTSATTKYCPNNWIVGLGYPAASAATTVVKWLNGDKSGSWRIGFATHHFELRQVIQFLVPLAIAAWLLLRAPQRVSPIGTMPNATAI